MELRDVIMETEAVALFDKIVEDVLNDPMIGEIAEEFHTRYCTLNEEDMKKVFTF